jgi:hypothetical protein
MHGFCVDLNLCLGFVVMIKFYGFCGNDKECMGFVLTLITVWVLW